jgi:predicted aspartyl protease
MGDRASSARHRRVLAGAFVATLLTVQAPCGLAQELGAVEKNGARSSLEGELVTEVPIELVGRMLVVPVELRGQTLRFLLDTGATLGAVTRSVARRLGLKPVGHAKLSGASGQARVPVVETRLMRLGDARAGKWEKYLLNDEILAHDDQHRFDGIVGSDLLRYYDVLIDAPARVLRLYKRGTTGTNGGPVVGREEAVSFDRIRSGIIRFPVSVNGSTIDAILDSGSPALLLNPSAADATGVELTEQPLSDDPRGIGRGTVQTYGTRIDSIDVGTVRLEALGGEMADLPIFGQLGLGDRPAMLVGSPFFLRCALLISWAARELRFCRQPVLAAAAPWGQSRR